jgi:curli biogenesis system outer membrane secretion channel CsgG
MKRLLLVSFLISGILLTSHVAVEASELVYFAPGFNLVHGATIAIAPFQNLTQAQSAGDRVSNYIANTFARSRMFRVYAENLFTIRIPYAGLSPALPVDRSISMKIGQPIGLNYVIFGSVVEYDYQLTPQGSRTLPIVGVDIRIVDINSGRIIFAGSFVKEGRSGSSIDDVAMDVVRSFYEKVVK